MNPSIAEFHCDSVTNSTAEDYYPSPFIPSNIVYNASLVIVNPVISPGF